MWVRRERKRQGVQGHWEAGIDCSSSPNLGLKLELEEQQLPDPSTPLYSVPRQGAVSLSPPPPLSVWGGDAHLGIE